MCGGFTCSKNSLIALNVLYIVVAITLISVAAYAKFDSIVTSISLVSGIITCGVLLLLLSIVGIVAASKHHQVLLFFYMIILFIIFVIQFSVACACLAMNKEQQSSIAFTGWQIADDNLRHQTELHFHCCGITGLAEDSNCTGVTQVNNQGSCCPPEDPLCCSRYANGTAHSLECKCESCTGPLQEAIGGALSTVGGIGLFFSFTEILGFILAKRFRHQIEPRAFIQPLVR